MSEKWSMWNLACTLACIAIFMDVVGEAVSCIDCLSLGGFPATLHSTPLVTQEISFLLIFGVAGVFPVIKPFKPSPESINKNDGPLHTSYKVSAVGIFRTDTQGFCFYVNPRWCDIAGRSPEQAKGEGWAQGLHPQDRDRVEEEWRVAARKGLAFQSEYRFQRSDGKITWVLGQAEAERDSSGKIIGYVGTITDISESKQVNENLQSTHLLLDAIRHAQSQYIANRNSKLIFDDLLSNILQLTQSKFGFIGEVAHSPEGKAYLKTHTIKNISWNRETQKLYNNYPDIGTEFYDLDTLFEAVIDTGEPVISNGPFRDSGNGGGPQGHPPLNSFLGLPFYHGGSMIGMVGIANRPTDYNEHLFDYLQPVLTTCSNLLQAFRNDEQRKRTEEALKKSEKNYKVISNQMRLIVEGTSSQSGEEFLKSLVSQLGQVLGVRHAMVGEITGKRKDKIRSLANWGDGKLVENIEYDLAGTPCQEVVGHNLCYFSDHVQEEFPQDELLFEMGIKSYMGLPLFDKSGNPFGILNVCHDQPIANPSSARMILSICVARAEMEIQRQYAEDALKESEQRFKDLLDNATAVVYIKDLEGRYLQVNALFEKLLHISKREIIGKTDHDIFPHQVADVFFDNDRKVWAKGEPVEFEEELEQDDGLHTYISVKFPLQDSHGKTYAVCGISTDITKRKMAESFIVGRNKILKLIATGCSLQETLDVLTRSAEEQAKGLYCSILLLDESGKRLFNGSSPSLPTDYVKAIDGFDIGPRAGSCGAAAYKEEMVIAEDIACDPLWADYKKTPLKYGLRACWSAPILSSNGQCLGTFALYYGEIRKPTEWELGLIKSSAHIAGLAIERHRDETALKEANDQLERRVRERTAQLEENEAYVQTILNNVMDALITVNLTGEIESFNAAAENIFGHAARDILGKNVTMIIPESYRDKHSLGFKKHVEGQDLNNFIKTDRSNVLWANLELKGLHKDGSVFPVEISISEIIYGEQTSFICVLRDITERKRTEAVVLGQNRTLEMLVKGKTLSEVLDTLSKSIEGLLDGVRCSLMTLDESGKYLRNRSAPSLQEAFLNKVGSFAVGPDIGTCGSAAHLNEMVVAEDVATDTRLGEVRDLLLEQGFKATVSCPIRNANGNVLGTFCIFFNKSKKPLAHEIQLIQSAANLAGIAIEQKQAEAQIKKSLDEKELLLKEVHHRTKNNMQIISSLLWLQSKDIQEEKYQDMFRDCSNRILSMALLHEKVYESPDLLEIDLQAYLNSLFSDLFASYGETTDRIEYSIETNGIFLDLDAGIPCGLLIQELVSNSLKHAFPDKRRGKIWLGLQPRDKGKIELIFGDDGIGFSEDLDYRKTQSLGLQLITTLAEKQLGGTIELDGTKGTVFNLTFVKGRI